MTMTPAEQDPDDNGPAQSAGGSVDTRPEGNHAAGQRQFVTFTSGDEVFAVDMTPVKEIIRVPDVVRVPLAPRTLDGLANLRGKVLPIISLRRIFGFAEKPHDDTTRALVIDLGEPLGFVVDRVSSVVGVPQEKIEDAASLQGAVNSELLSGIIKDVGGYPMIMVLDFAKVIAQEFQAIAELSSRNVMGTGALSSNEAPPGEAQDELQLVSFSIAEQEYAIKIEDVQEIVQVPATIIRVPHSDSHVLGLMTLRDRLLSLVSLRQMFDLPPEEINEQSRIVVVSLGAASVGIVVDRVNEVLRVALSDLDDLPGLLAREQDGGEIAGMCRLEDGKRLVSIISARNLFRNSAIKEALTTMSAHSAEIESDSAHARDALDEDEQVVVFLLDKEEYGISIENVQEIVRVPETLTRVPQAPAFVEGVINLRGAVLPVIDLRQRLGLARVARSDQQRIMVFLIGGLRTGFIVDSVAEVLKIPKSAIVATPQFSSEQGGLLTRMANLERQKRLVQLLAPADLIAGRDLADLTQMAA